MCRNKNGCSDFDALSAYRIAFVGAPITKRMYVLTTENLHRCIFQAPQSITLQRSEGIHITNTLFMRLSRHIRRNYYAVLSHRLKG